MRRILLAGASLLAVGASPLLAQEAAPSASGPTGVECRCPDTQAIDAGSTEAGARAETSGSRGAADENDGPAREAMGDAPLGSGQSADTASATEAMDEMPFPPQDVSDQDLEPGGTPYPSGYPDPAAASAGQAGDEGSEDLIEEGEQVPPAIGLYQGEDMWEGDGEFDVDADSGPSTVEEKRRAGDSGQRLSAEGGPAGAWDGPEEGPPFHRGELHPDRAETGATGESAQQRSSRQENPRARREAMDRDAIGERRLRLARIALRTARQAVPDAHFRTYKFERSDGRRVIEIGGTDLDSGSRVEVDVYPNGRVHSISQAIPLEAVPDEIRDAVRSELGRFRVARSLRSLRRDFDLYYEFAGFVGSGRPVTVDIRADGRDMNVRYLDRS